MRIAAVGAMLICTIIRVAIAVPEDRNLREQEVNSSRIYLQRKISRWLPGDSGALAAGLLLGGDEDLSPAAVVEFRKAGLSHITAASGYNVVVVAGWMMGMMSGWLGRRKALYIGMVCTILYMYLAGMTVPVLRAGLMVIAGYAGLFLGRKTDSWQSLAVISMAMVIYRPAWIFDISFQLSVAATVGVMYAGMTMENINENKWVMGMAANLKTSLAAWIATLPIILHYFGQLSLVAPVANLAVVWAVPPVMEVLGLAMAVGMVWDGGGWLVSMLAWPGLKFILSAAGWFAAWPGAGMQTAKMAWEWVAVYYLVIGLALVRLRRYPAGSMG